MNTKKHAIHTAESLLAKTIEVGDCLEWQGYFANGTPYVSNNGKMTSVRRLFSGLLNKNFVAGGFIVPKCDNHRCINPNHAMRLSRSKMSSRNGKRAVQSIAKRLKIQKFKQQTEGKLSWDKVDEIRATNVPSRVLAEKFGVDKSLICRVRTGQAWKRIENNIFAGLM